MDGYKIKSKSKLFLILKTTLKFLCHQALYNQISSNATINICKNFQFHFNNILAIARYYGVRIRPLAQNHFDA